MYRVKTRNWNESKIAGFILNRLPVSTDGQPDAKYWFETQSIFKAWLTWCAFMAVSRLSGGWTYITYPDKSTDGRYLSIYR